MSYLNLVTLQLPWARGEFSFLYNTFFPELTGFSLLRCGVLVKHTALDGFTAEQSPGTDKLLSPECCAQENPISAWAVLWGQMGGRAK